MLTPINLKLIYVLPHFVKGMLSQHLVKKNITRPELLYPPHVLLVLLSVRIAVGDSI